MPLARDCRINGQSFLPCSAAQSFPSSQASVWTPDLPEHVDTQSKPWALLIKPGADPDHPSLFVGKGTDSQRD